MLNARLRCTLRTLRTLRTLLYIPPELGIEPEVVRYYLELSSSVPRALSYKQSLNHPCSVSSSTGLAPLTSAHGIGTNYYTAPGARCPYSGLRTVTLLSHLFGCFFCVLIALSGAPIFALRYTKPQRGSTEASLSLHHFPALPHYIATTIQSTPTVQIAELQDPLS
eukprot:IDg6081t1